MSDPQNQTSETPEPPPLRSSHTSNFPGLLQQLNASLLVTTYQAQKVLLIRNDAGKLNTHFRDFEAPMGLALAGDRLAIGTLKQIWEFHNIPAVAARLEPPGSHDACFLPRSCHFTGNVQIHEMAWGKDQLYFVNTRFSCICTLDKVHSFVPWWRPPFISALTPEDRCHINGMAMLDGLPRFVTALGKSDEPAGWRENKARGGIVIDVPSGEIVATGLSMPHSPHPSGAALGLRFRQRHPGYHRPGQRQVSTGRQRARLHPRPGDCRQSGVRRALTGS